MKTNRNGNSSPVSQPPVEHSDAVAGSHNHRQVTEEPDQANQVPDQPSTIRFRTLKERHISPEPVSNGAIGFLTSIFSPLIMVGMNASVSQTIGRLQKTQNGLRDKLAKDSKHGEAIQKELEMAEKKLAPLRKAMTKSLTPAQTNEYLATLQSIQNLHHKFASVKAQCIGLEMHIERMFTQMQNFKHQTEQKQMLTKTAIQVCARLLGGLRNIFQPNPVQAQPPVVREIDLGELKMGKKGHYEIILQGLKLSVEEFHKKSDGSVLLNVAEISGRCTTIGANGDAAAPVTFNGGMKATIKQPFANLVVQMMECSLITLPFYMPGMMTEFNQKADQAESQFVGREPGIKNCIEIEVNALNANDSVSGKTESILEREGLGIILQLLTPMVRSYKSVVNDQIPLKMPRKKALLNAEAQARKLHISALTELSGQLKKDLASIPDGETTRLLKTHVATQSAKINADLADLEAKRQEYAKAMMDYQAVLKASDKWRKSGRNKWVESFTNASNLILALREAERHGTENNPVKLYCPAQRVLLGLFSHADIQHLEASISEVTLDSKGSLTITVPEIRSRVTVESDITDQSHTEEVCLKGLQVTVDSPLGKIMHDVLKLNFPLDMVKLQLLTDSLTELWAEDAFETFQTGRPDPGRLVHVETGELSLTRDQGDVFASGEYEPDTQALTDATSQFTGRQLPPDFLESSVGRVINSKSPEYKKLMHMMAMILLDVPGAVMK